MSHILAIDAGTTGVTALLVDPDGRLVDSAYREFPQYFPRPGWVEQDAEEIWAATKKVAADLLAERPDAEIAGIGITNQRETTVVWERSSGKPIHRAIVWQCRRTADQCERLRADGHSDAIAAKTGLVIDPYFSATKLRWTLDHVETARANADALAFGTVDTWLIWKLTGGAFHVTDCTNASRTMLLNIDRREWDADLCDLFDIPLSMLPDVALSSSRFGTTRGLGFLPDGIPIVGVAGDQQSALYGQTCFEPGSAKNTYGTGCFLLMNAGETRPKSEHGLLTTLACAADGSPVYASEGAVFIAGAAIQWLRDGLEMIESARESEALATSVEDAAGVVFVPAFAGLGAPYWDAEARGAMFGITRGTTRAHLVRAALEAIAQSSADVFEAMAKDVGEPLTAIRVDGGASANDFLMQFQADVLGATVERPEQVETTALGAAYLAGLQVGAWSSDDLRSLNPIDRRFTPQIDGAARETKRGEWRSAVARLRHRPTTLTIR